jgi:hypothetical protein
MKSFLSLALLLILAGCGNSNELSPDAPAPGGLITVPAGSVLQPRPAVAVRFINHSSQVTQADQAKICLWLNWQLLTDFNSRWKTEGSSLVIYSGDVDNSVPTVYLEDATDDSLDGANPVTTDYTVWRIRVLPHTLPRLSAYCSHGTINAVRPDFLPGQLEEGTNYGYLDYGPRAELCDFTFPNKAGFAGDFYDFQGKPAYDLMHVLAYP